MENAETAGSRKKVWDSGTLGQRDSGTAAACRETRSECRALRFGTVGTRWNGWNAAQFVAFCDNMCHTRSDTNGQFGHDRTDRTNWTSLKKQRDSGTVGQQWLRVLFSVVYLSHSVGTVWDTRNGLDRKYCISIQLWYKIYMEFEFDPTRSAANKVRHGIDFDEALALWEDVEAIEILLPFAGESRFMVIGQIDGLHWSAIITYRGTARRIISVRRSRANERELYDNSKRI